MSIASTVAGRASGAAEGEILCWEDEVDDSRFDLIHEVEASARKLLPSDLEPFWDEDGNLIAGKKKGTSSI